MNIEEKKKKIAELQTQLNSLLKRRDQLEARGDQLKWENYSNNFISYTDNELRHNERGIMILQDKIADLKTDVDTWAYTIMGNIEAEVMYGDFLDIILKKLTSTEQEEYDGIHKIVPDDIYTEIINYRCYDDLVEFAFKHNSRLAFQVLGVLIMEHGARMTEKLREFILSNSRWEDEAFQFKNEKDKRERKRYLFEFREKVKNYREGVITKITIIRQTDLMDEKIKSRDDTLIDRPSIDYSIRKE